MRYLKYIFFFFIIHLFIRNVVSQNQLNVVEYMVYQPIINPASIASFNSLSGTLVYRKQWVGLEGAPETAFLFLNSPISKTNLFIGGNFYFDRIGANNEMKTEMNIAYRLKLSQKNYLSLAINGGISSNQANYDGLYFNDDNDSEFTSNHSNSLLPTSGFSTYLFSSNYYFGYSIPNFFKNYNSIKEDVVVDINNIHNYLNFGYKVKLNQKLDLNISSLIKSSIGAPIQFDINSQILYLNRLGLGLNYRSSRELALIATIYFENKLGISYAYDYGFSATLNYNRNSHEIMLLFGLPSRERLKISSPRF